MANLERKLVSLSGSPVRSDSAEPFGNTPTQSQDALATFSPDSFGLVKEYASFVLGMLHQFLRLSVLDPDD